MRISAAKLVPAVLLICSVSFARASQPAAQDRELAEFDRLISQGNYKEVEPQLERYVGRDPESWKALYQLGYVYFRRHKIVSSVRVLSRSLALHPDHAEAHKILGMNLTILGEIAMARKELALAAAQKPDCAECRYALGRLEYEHGNYAEAVKELVAAVTLDPAYVKAYDNLGLAYDAAGQPERASEAFEKALFLNSRRAKPSEWPFIDFAFFYNRRQQYAKAVELAARAAEINPDSERAHAEAAAALRGLNRLEESVRSLRTAIRLNPSKPEYLYMLAQIYGALGKLPERRAALDQFRSVKAETESERPKEKR